MSVSPNPKNSVHNALKLYLFPSLVSILAMMIWRDVSELRADVKQLLAQSNIDKTDIQNLKREVFKTPPPVAASINFGKLYVIHDEFFKHEDFFDVNKYLPKS